MPTISLQGRDERFACEAHDTITRAALRAGIAVPYDCNTGSCGTCKMELVEGEIISRRPDSIALTDRDRARRRVLGCQAVPVGDCVIRVRVESDAPPLVPCVHRATLVRSTPITHDMREFRFELDEPARFLPGQYALLHFSGIAAPRAYSMSNACDDRYWDFIVKLVPGGEATSALFTLPVGSAIVLDGPYGHAYLRAVVDRDVVCIAGGSGLGPVLSIARAASAAPLLANRRLFFFYGGRGRRDLAGQPQLDALPALAGRCTYVPVVSDAGDDEWRGLTGFVHDAVPSMLDRPLADYEYYFAGPPAMTLATQKLLLDAKVPLSQLHFDQFF